LADVIIEISSKACSTEGLPSLAGIGPETFEGHPCGEFTALASSICRDDTNYIKLIEDEFGDLPIAA
jgi:hypothetical protein